MSAHSKHTSRSPLRILKIVLLCLAGTVALAVALLACLTWYLSSGHLREIVEERASSYFAADCTAAHIDFTIWSTFPHFRLEVDSINVVSRTLHRSAVTAAQRAALPANADSLAFLRHMSGSVNLVKLLFGKVELHEVEASGFRLNMVTLNDSVNNFDILPHDTLPFDMPYISVDKVSLRDIYDCTFYSAPNRLNARTSLSDISLTRRSPRSDSYNVAVRGKISAQFNGMPLVTGFPFDLGGDVDFSFKPFALKFENMRVQLANVSTTTSATMDFGERSKISNLHSDISTFDLMRLLEYLPSEFLSGLEGVKGDLRTSISIRLTKPYHFAGSALPCFEAVLTVPDSRVTYTMADGTSYVVNGIKLRASLTFDGDNWQQSYCTIDGLEAAGEGMKLLLKGEITQVFSDPRFHAALRVDADLSRLAAAIPPVNSYRPGGTAVLTSILDFPLSLIGSGEYRHIPLRAEAVLSDVSVRLPDGGRVSARDGRVTLANKSGRPLAATADLSGIAMSLPEGIRVNASQADATVLAAGRFPDAEATLRNVDMALPQGLSLSIPEFNLRLPGLRVQNLAFDALVPTARLREGGKKELDMGSLRAHITLADGTIVELTGDTLTLDLGERRMLTAGDVAIEEHSGDRVTLRVKRLHYSMPDFADTTRLMRATMNDATVRLLLRDGRPRTLGIDAARASLRMAAYPAPITITDLGADLFTDNDSISLRSLHVASLKTAFSLSGTYRRSRRDGKPFNRLRAKLDVDTLHFNQMAHIFTSGSAYKASDDTENEAPKSAFMVPGDWDAVIDAKAKATVYTNLWLYDLAAKCRMQPGVMALDTLYLSADFGHAGASMRYFSPDRDSLRAEFGARVYNFNLTEFFDSYPNVLALMPQMGNLHGIFHANARTGFQIFPSMDINTGSMTASIKASATDLYLHQNPFIKKLMHMALIFRDGDIHIPSIEAEARVFDHLLQVYPFDIYLDRYHLRAEGRNNFSGDLYYHLAVLKTPIPLLRFGINIGGMYHHPKLRFTTSRYSPQAAQRIDHIDVNDRINIIDMARHYGWLLIRHAAKADIDGGSK